MNFKRTMRYISSYNMMSCLRCKVWFYEDGLEPMYEGVCECCLANPTPAKDNSFVFQLPDLSQKGE